LWLISSSIQYSYSQHSSFKNPANEILGNKGTLEKGPWAFFTNPAGLSDIDYIIIGIGNQNDFLIQELNARTIFASIPYKSSTLTAGYTYTGFRLFNIQEYNFALAKQLAPWLNMGIRFNYSNRQQNGKMKAQIFTINAGWQLIPLEQIQLGFYMRNPTQNKWRTDYESKNSQTLIATSLAYHPSKNIVLEAGISKYIDYDPSVSLMLTSKIYKTISIKGNVSSSPLRIGLGSSLTWQNSQFDIGLSHHETLGLSSAIGLIYNLSKKK